jgi:acetyl-CoA C-acetyltransferase
VAVVGVDVTASALPGDMVRDLYALSFDAWTEGMTGTTATALYALSWQAWAAQTGATDADLAGVVMKNRANACLNPQAHLPRRHTADEIDAAPLIAAPYRRLHCSPLSDGAAAVILARPADLPASRRQAARVLGIGAATDRAQPGARADIGDFAAKRLAMTRALSMANLAPSDIAGAEVYDAYAGAELQALSALGLAGNAVAELRDGRFAAGGALPVNLSGGLLGQGAPPGATGVAQVATCAALVEGRYHPGLQPAVPPRVALADSHGGLCTTAAVTLIGAAA